MLDKQIQQLDLLFPAIYETLDKSQESIVAKFEDIDKQFDEVSQLFQFQFFRYQCEIKELQVKQEQQQLQFNNHKISNQVFQQKSNLNNNNKRQIRQITIEERSGAIYVRKITAEDSADRKVKFKELIRNQQQNKLSVFDQQEQAKYIKRNFTTQDFKNRIASEIETIRKNGFYMREKLTDQRNPASSFSLGQAESGQM